MQIGSWGPPELGRRGGACGEEDRHGGALRLGHGQPEERPNVGSAPGSSRVQVPYFRTGDFFQCCGTHELAAVGRHPKCVLTESMPSAMLLTPNMLISSGVTRGFFISPPLRVRPGFKKAGATVSRVLLTPGASKNQP